MGLSGALAMEARPALYLPLSSSTRLDFDVQISEESRRPHPSLKDPLFYLLMISSALVMIFEFLRHILRVCFFFEIGSVEAVFPERGEPLRFREVSELLPYDRVLRGYRMTHTLFFPYVVDEDRLKKSLSSTLAAYPSFASVIVERRGRTFLDWGDSKGVPFTVQTRRTPMRRKDFIHGSFQYAGDVSLAPDRWGAVRFFQKVRDAALSPWELLGRPALRVSVVRILSKPNGRWAPVQHSGGLNRIPASPNAAAGSENYPSSSYVTLAWSHALCDGPSMMAFLSHWAAACRGQKLEMYHPGPFDPLSQEEAERLRGVFESEVTGPALSPRNSFVFRRCFFSRSRLEGYGMSLLGVQGSDVVASLLCLDLVKICGVEVRLSFMQDMRLHLPSLRAYVGNFARLSEPRAAGGRTLEALAGEVASLRHGASGQWRSSARTSQGVLPGRPCHPSLKDPLFYLLMISSALVMIFEFLGLILRVCFFFEIGSVEAVFPERGEPLRFREVSELLPYDRVLRGYRMTHTIFFPYVVDEDRLKKSLSSTLAAYPSFASVIVERRGRTFLDWGDSKGVPFTVQTRRTPMRRKDFIHGSFQYAGDVSLAPDRWGAVR